MGGGGGRGMVVRALATYGWHGGQFSSNWGWARVVGFRPLVAEIRLPCWPAWPLQGELAAACLRACVLVCTCMMVLEPPCHPPAHPNILDVCSHTSFPVPYLRQTWHGQLWL